MFNRIRILLLHPPTSSRHPEPPLGIGYIGAALKYLGHDVRILDMEPLGIGFKDLPNKINEISPRLIGVSFMTSQYSYAMKCFQAARSGAPDAVTVAGGVHTSALPLDVMKNHDVDFAVLGEGEITLSELVGALVGGPSAWGKIPGLAYRDKNEIFLTSPRGLIENLDDLPMPLWEELSKAKYSDIPLGIGKEVDVFPIITGRGCPNNCNFCASQVIFHRKLRMRSPENVFLEMETLYNRFNARHFNFLDDTLTINKKNLLRICDMILNAGWNIEWRCTARVNTVDLDLLKAMKRAGCRMVTYGVESGDPQILRNIKKNINLEQVQEAFRLTSEAGLQSMGLFMVGNLGETKSSILKTIDFINTLGADFVACSILTPYPGTEIYEIAKERGWLREGNWDMFVPTPHSIKNFKPLMVTESMGEEELLDAYYLVIRSFSRAKLRRAYGKNYYFNPFFYKKEILNRIQAGGVQQFITLLRRIR